MADQNRGRTSLAVSAFPGAAASSPAAEYGSPAAEYGNQARSGQRQSAGKRPQAFSALMLRNWRVRWRVLALVIVPTVAAIALGLVRVEAANTTASNFGRISQLATLGRDFTVLTQSVEDERDLSAGYLASKQSGDTAPAAVLLTNLKRQYGVTDSEGLRKRSARPAPATRRRRATTRRRPCKTSPWTCPTCAGSSIRKSTRWR
jgi:hypothetical protein